LTEKALKLLAYAHAYCNIADKGWIEEYTRYTNIQYTK